jgi:hypothetical protein
VYALGVPSNYSCNRTFRFVRVSVVVGASWGFACASLSTSPLPTIADAESDLDVDVLPAVDGGVSDSALRDATVRDGSLPRDAGADRDAAQAVYSDAGACGICDRVWVCNGFANDWKTEADGRCVNQYNRTALRCNGVMDGDRFQNLGTWLGDARELELRFGTGGGGFQSYFCYPP